MITYKVDQKSFNEFVKELRQLGHIISDPNMQLYRAKKFREYVVNSVRDGSMDLRPLTELTQIISGSPHNPIWATGNVVEHMGVKPTGRNSAEAGYWDSDTEVLPGKKITYTGWVRALHTGFRIPLKGEKGEKVRWWFRKYHDVIFRADKEWLVVPPRPFVWWGYFKYITQNKDVEVVDEYLKKLANSPIDRTKTKVIKEAKE